MVSMLIERIHILIPCMTHLSHRLINTIPLTKISFYTIDIKEADLLYQKSLQWKTEKMKKRVRQHRIYTMKLAISQVKKRLD
jgi:hypothetical protein